MRLHAIAGAGIAALIGLTVATGTASAAPGYLNQGMNLRSGPGVDYPLVASLPPGTQAEIFGCLPQWSWCDVAIGDLRGWMAGAGLQVVYDDQPEPLVGYGGQIGLPFIGFDFGNYWGNHYRGRSWYSPVDRWHGGGPGGYGGPGGDRGHDFGPGRGGPGGGPGRDQGGRDFGPGPGGGPGGGPRGFPGNHGADRGGPGPGQGPGPGGGGRGGPQGRAPQQAGPREAPQAHGGPGGHEGGNRGPAPGGGHGGPDDHGPH